MEVRHTEKFQTVYEAMKQDQGKRQKPKEIAPSQESHEDDRVPSKRPLGQKQSKQKSKKHDGEDEYAVQFATFIEMKAEEHRKHDQRWKAEKDLEERKLLWEQEQKIMFCDTSVLDETQKTYVIAMRKHIASAKEASVKGGVSTTVEFRVGFWVCSMCILDLHGAGGLSFSCYADGRLNLSFFGLSQLYRLEWRLFEWSSQLYFMEQTHSGSNGKQHIAKKQKAESMVGNNVIELTGHDVGVEREGQGWRCSHFSARRSGSGLVLKKEG
ncbi:hypothetical protein HU200_062039 [Digitaria exilis]|uniref:No apical meristem-associated C-terminal domain-containing protein n=1 Tax=Digitaria exilis TaxID=1010633 RepID=A0A835DW75_9POAL|nr:hypothetical protein HU200_062039 [Digitaria exilis]